MSTQLRDMFDAAAESEVPNGITERAIGAASRRRRSRWIAGAAVLAVGAVALSLVVSVSGLRSDANPDPTDFATIPKVLPALEELPSLQPGDLEAASISYIVGDQLVLVDAVTGDAFRYPTGPPSDLGAVDDVFLPTTDVALSPDGERALMTVAPMPGDSTPTVRVLDFATAREVVVPDLTPADDAGGTTLMRPSAYSWRDDSGSFLCACAETDVPHSDGWVPRLFEVVVDGSEIEVRLAADASDVSPVQVVVGAAGTFVHMGGADGSWKALMNLDDGLVEDIYGPTLALGRGEEFTYIVDEGSHFTVGSREQGTPVWTTVDIPGLKPTGGAIGDLGTDLDAVVGGFVAVIAIAHQRGEFASVDEQIIDLSAYFIMTDGTMRELTSFPDGTFTASFASDLVAP